MHLTALQTVLSTHRAANRSHSQARCALPSGVSLSPHTQWLRLYPTMQTAMHLQCRVQLLAKSQHPIATLNSHSARSQSVGGTSVTAFAASRDALSILRVSSSAVNTQCRPWHVLITSQLESDQRRTAVAATGSGCSACPWKPLRRFCADTAVRAPRGPRSVLTPLRGHIHHHR